ncbi:hypothetical protein [Halomarina litorea]|uniref:hypothetical protein n=1 Tax=Halomarina litorea TaxID=2961595 RepID=UPI0020C4FA8D|nr:hypothetical protein [Halomarina sp. BCD28]
MTDRTIVSCEDCQHVYTARVRDDGGLILPTPGNACGCGCESFAKVTAQQI